MTDARATGEVHGNVAQRFAETELEELEVDVVAWTATYRDPTDGSIWVMDYPQAEVKEAARHASGVSATSPRQGSFRNTGPGESPTSSGWLLIGRQDYG